jgi:Mg/Co/Ni transporter MgtE
MESLLGKLERCLRNYFAVLPPLSSVSGNFFKRLFNRKAEVVDSKTSIEMHLTSLVKAAREGNPQPLTDALCRLEPNDLNTLLTNTKNEVLTSLMDNSKKENPQLLTDVLLGLEFNDLKGVFIDGKNEILDLLLEDKASENLAWVLSRLDSDNLNEILRNEDNKILNLLVEKGSSEHLAWMFFKLKPTDLNAILQTNTLNSGHLAAALGCLKPDALNEELTKVENGVLAYLIEAAQERTR